MISHPKLIFGALIGVIQGGIAAMLLYDAIDMFLPRGSVFLMGCILGVGLGFLEVGFFSEFIEKRKRDRDDDERSGDA